MANGDSAAWDAQAATFDDEPDHGLRDPGVRQAWAALLEEALPEPPAVVADLGCGTGSLAVLLAGRGHVVYGLDASQGMLDEARRKAVAHGAKVSLVRGDAGWPPFAPGRFDVVLVRHVLWAFDENERAEAVRQWVGMLRASGRLVLIEGRWSTGAGLTAEECTALVPGHVRHLRDPALWGGPIADERYLLTFTPAGAGSRDPSARP